MRTLKKEKETEEAKKAAKRTAQEQKAETKLEPKLEEAEAKEVRKERIREREREAELAGWIPKTKLGKDVKEGKIKNIDEVLKANLLILEPEIIDLLIPDLETDLINIGQAKGKFGGGKRRPWRQTQKKTAEGNVPMFTCMAAAGDKAGHVGLGAGKARETVPAKQKAFRAAKLAVMSVKRGCGSFECVCKEPHSIPCAVEGKSGSAVMKLMPAPKGTGLVIDNECKKILKLAGIKDIYSKTFGKTRTKFNLAKATIAALQKLGKVV